MARKATITLLLAFVSLLIISCSQKKAPTEVPRPVRTLVTTANQQQLAAEYAGSIVARVESQLAFRVGGKIQARKVDVGSQVKAGQILMQLDAQDLKLALAQAQANSRTANTNYDLAALELKRFRDLHATDSLSLSALDAKNAAFEAAKALFEQAQALLREQENQTQYANLKADVDGVVTAIEAEIGQVVAPAFAVIKLAQMGGQAALDKPSDLEMALEIPENNLELINKANAIEVQLWASRKEVFRGRIREIAPAADPLTRAFTAKISFIDVSEKQSKLLKLGMTASAKFLLTTPQEFIKLPLSALLYSQGKTQVWQVIQAHAQPTDVKVVGINGNEVLVNGLAPGQTIVTAGVHVLQPGQSVTLLPALAPPTEGAASISAQAIMAPVSLTPAPPDRTAPSAVLPPAGSR